MKRGEAAKNTEYDVRFFSDAATRPTVRLLAIQYSPFFLLQKHNLQQKEEGKEGKGAIVSCFCSAIMLSFSIVATDPHRQRRFQLLESEEIMESVAVLFCSQVAK